MKPKINISLILEFNGFYEFTTVQIHLFQKKKLYTKLKETGRRATIPVQSTVNRNPRFHRDERCRSMSVGS